MDADIPMQTVNTTTNLEVTRKMVYDELSQCPQPTIRVMDGHKSNIGTLFAYPCNQKLQFLIGMVALFFSMLSNFAVPGLIGVVLNAMKEKDQHAINYYCLLMMVIVIISSGFSWVRGTTFNTISERVAKYLRYDIVIHLLKKDVGFYDVNKTGDILSRISTDTEVIQNGMGTNISMLIRALTFIAGTMVVLTYISW